MEAFEEILAATLSNAALERGWQYRSGGAREWARTGCAFLSMALQGGTQADVRLHQSRARMTTGPVLLECSQYDTMAGFCLAGNDSAVIGLVDGNGKTSELVLTKDLFLEMLDFLREG